MSDPITNAIPTIGEMDKQRLDLARKLEMAENALRCIATGPRPDGTYNRDRKSCGMLACEALEKIMEAGE